MAHAHSQELLRLADVRNVRAMGVRTDAMPVMFPPSWFVVKDGLPCQGLHPEVERSQSVSSAAPPKGLLQ